MSIGGNIPYSKRTIKLVLLIIVIIILLILLIIGIALSSKNDSGSRSIKFKSDSPLKNFEKAVVVSNIPECSQIGSDILRYKKGSAVDAAIAALICQGVTSPISLGLGGGFLMTIYDAPSGKVEFLNARETAPGSASATMFKGNESLGFSGGLAVAVPGQIAGFWEAHRKYGRAAWRDLFEPSIKLCVDGYVNSGHNAYGLRMLERQIRAETTMMEFSIDPRTNKLYATGDCIKQPKLAKALRILADAADPVDLFYRGEMAKQLAAEIKRHGGIITPEDFAKYKVKWTEPHRADLGDMTIYTSPPPGSGILFTFMLEVLKDLVPAENDVILCQRIVETFKFAFAKRGDIADPDFVDTSEVIAKYSSIEYINHVRSLIKDDKTYDDPKHYGATSYTKPDAGTGHIAVLAPDGSAVSVTGSINDFYGAKFASQSTGIVFNNQMEDFGSPGFVNVDKVPPAPKNFIQPYKRPVSSMVPTIVLDKTGRVKLVIGASGGTAIPMSCAYIAALYFWNDYTLKEAIDAHRLYHQLFPSWIEIESNFPKDILTDLEKIGHKHDVKTRGNVANAIAIGSDGVIVANADYRHAGAAVGF